MTANDHLEEINVTGESRILPGTPITIDQTSAASINLWKSVLKAITTTSKSATTPAKSKRGRKSHNSIRIQVALNRNIKSARRAAVARLIHLATGGSKTSGSLKMRFKINSANKVIIKKPSGDGAYTCQACGQRFTKEGFYERHVLAMHNPARAAEKVTTVVAEKPVDYEELETSTKSIKNELHNHNGHDIEDEQEDEVAEDPEPMEEDEPNDEVSGHSNGNENIKAVVKEEPSGPQKAPQTTPTKRYNRDPSTCEHCSKTFLGPAALANHVRLTHGRRPAPPKKKRGSRYRLSMPPRRSRKTEDHQLPDAEEDGEAVKLEVDADDQENEIDQKGDAENVQLSPRYSTHECAVCGVLRQTERAMISHAAEAHDDQRPFKCRFCTDAKYSNVAHRLRHERTSHPDLKEVGRYNIPCPKCDIICDSEELLAKHSMGVHGTTRPFQCDKCKNVFQHIFNFEHHNLIEHLESGELPDKIPNLPVKAGLPIRGTIPNSPDAHSPVLRTHTLVVRGAPPQPIERNVRMICFNCVDCHQKFTNELTFIQHSEKEHNNPKPFTCQACQVGFVAAYMRLRHEEIIHKLSRQQVGRTCRSCGELFDGEDDLRRHYSLVHGSDRPFLCLVCEADFANNWGRIRHERMVHTNDRLMQIENKSYLCRLCSITCVTEPQIIEHFRDEHPDEKPFKCFRCPHTFQHRYRCRQHETKYHDPIGARPVESAAPLSHAGSAALRRPMMKSVGGLPTRVQLNVRYECKDCDMRFPNEILYQQHMERVHNDPKPFKCPKCTAEFSNNWGYLRHDRQSHAANRVNNQTIVSRVPAGKGLNTTNAPLNYKCRKCTAKFAYEMQLRKHFQEAHNSMRAFECERCETTFIYEYKRRQHEKICRSSNLVASHNSVNAALALARRQQTYNRPMVRPIPAYKGSPFEDQESRNVPFVPKHYTCDRCGVRCDSEKEYYQHSVDAHNCHAPFKCRQCDTRFKYNYSRTKHERRHADLGETTVHRRPTGYHIRPTVTSVPRRLSGEDVGPTLVRRQEPLTSFKEEVLASSEDAPTDETVLPYACIACNASYATEPELLEHVVIHE